MTVRVGLADQLEPRQDVYVPARGWMSLEDACAFLRPPRRTALRLTVTRSLAFRALCGFAQAPRFYVGLAVGGLVHLSIHLAGLL